ncbi:MAG: TolC family protein [Bacteroides sp.]
MKNILFLVLSLSVLSLQAQNRKSLYEYILLAWKQNPGFRNSSIHVKETCMDYLTSIGNFLPRAQVTTEAGRRFGHSIDPNTNGYTTDTFDDGTVGLDMTLSLFEGFSRINRVRFEKLNLRKSKWELREQQNDLAYRVTDTYYKVLLEERLLHLAHEQATLSGLERLTKMRKQKLNIYRWQNEKEQTEQQLYTEVAQTVLSLHAGYQEHRQATLQLNAERLVLKESERKWEEGLISVFQLMEARNRFISAKAELTRVRLQTEMNIQLEEYYRTGYFGPHSL